MEVEVNWLDPRISLHRPLLDNEAQRDDFEAMTATWVGEDTRVTWKYFIFLPISKQTSCPSTEWMYGLMLLCHSWVYMSGSSIARALNYIWVNEGGRKVQDTTLNTVWSNREIYIVLFLDAFQIDFSPWRYLTLFFPTGEFVIQNFESGLLKITDTSGPRTVHPVTLTVVTVIRFHAQCSSIILAFSALWRLKGEGFTLFTKHKEWSCLCGEAARLEPFY